MSSELEKSGIRVAVGDCSVTERGRWHQTGKTVHVHAKHYKHNEDRRTALVVCSNGSVPLSHSGNVFTRIGKHTQRRHCTVSDFQTEGDELCVADLLWLSEKTLFRFSDSQVIDA